VWSLAGGLSSGVRVTSQLDTGDCHGMGDGSMQNESW